MPVKSETTDQKHFPATQALVGTMPPTTPTGLAIFANCLLSSISTTPTVLASLRSRISPRARAVARATLLATSPIWMARPFGDWGVAYDPTSFDCGNDALNRFIKLYALPGQRAGKSQTYVAATGPEIIGYHTLVVGQVAHDDAPDRLAKGLPRHPVPVIILARLAVDQTWQGKGLGAALVVDAMRRILQAADIAGVRAMVVHAKDEVAQRFYEYLGFVPFTGKPLTLNRLLKDICAMRGE
jgi:GNAT superfamily N-acetyltransferase